MQHSWETDVMLGGVLGGVTSQSRVVILPLNTTVIIARIDSHHESVNTSSPKIMENKSFIEEA